MRDMETINVFETDSESGIFGTFILQRIRELFGAGNYAETVPMYAERVAMTPEDLKRTIRGDILPDIRIIQDMKSSDTMGLEVSLMYKYVIRSKERYPGYKLEY